MDQNRIPSFWSVIPDTVLSATDIKPNAKLLYAKITSLQTATGYCYATNKYLANGLGIAPDTITRLLKELSDAGYLHLEIIRDANNSVLERRIFTTITLPKLPDTSRTNIRYPSRINAEDPPGQTSDTPPGQTSDKEYILENKEEIPPIAPQGGKRGKEPKKQPAHNPERFCKFWDVYPHSQRKNKQGAIRAWDKLAPSDALCDKMARALKEQMKSDEWRRGIGIPYPSTWLNNRRWEDETVDPAPVAEEYDPRGGLQSW